MNKELECCTICPHNCKINRTKNPGRCKSTDKIKIALYSIHNFEEPCISGEKGSGTIFFSNCNMNCVFCQNYEISQLGRGKEITIDEIEKELHVSKEDIILAKEAARKVESIENATYTNAKDGNTISLIEKISTNKDEEEILTNKLVIKELINGLEKRDKEVIMLRFFKEKTQAQVAKILGVTQVQVSRIERKILNNMKLKLSS